MFTGILANGGRITDMNHHRAAPALLLGILAAGSILAADEPPTVADPLPFAVELQMIGGGIEAGAEFALGVFCADTTLPLGGFNLLIEYDFGDLVLDSATLGSLTTGEWEYFDISTGFVNREDEADLRTWLRLVAIADSHAESKHPSARSLVGPGELARLYFFATDALAADSTGLRFFWRDCGDNSFSDLSGNKLLLAVETDSVRIDGMSYRGVDPECYDNRRNPPLPVISFRNIWLRIPATDPILPDSS
ncbi:MAG: hypothetical protein ABIJ61_03490 [bacterium]